MGMLVLPGCSQQANNSASSAGTSNASEVETLYVTTEEPKGAVGVIKAREATGNGDDVVITGRIGGSSNPWIDGRLAFPIVDESLKACSDIPGDTCQKPWDYCCETDKLPGATALVKVVDHKGQAVKGDAKEMLKVKELSTVVVEGKAERDEAGNLTIVANQIYVKE